MGQTIAWMVIFFFASPAASAAYLTVSETFPLEVRALVIALFYSSQIVWPAVGVATVAIVITALDGEGARRSAEAIAVFTSSRPVQ